MAPTKEALDAQVKAKGDEIRAAKAAQKPKDVIVPLVSELKALKAQYESVAGEPWQPAPAQPAPAQPADPKVAAIEAKVNAKGDDIRKLKAAKASKDEVMVLVAELNALKAEYEAAAGKSWPAPAPAPKKKKGQQQQKQQAKKSEGPSKNEAKKAARKAAAAAKKAEYKDAKKTGAPPPSSGKKGKPSSVGGMSVQQVSAFLRSVALDKYSDAFAKAGIDGAKLESMGDAELAAAGMSFAPHRRKLLKMLGGGGSSGGGGALGAVLKAAASAVAQSSPLLASVQEALAAVREQLGEDETTAAKAPYSHPAHRAPAPAPAAAGAPAAAAPARAAAPPGVDKALAACAHRFYVAVGISVECKRAGGGWEPAIVSGPPKDDLGCWQLKGGEGDGAWTATVPFSDIRPKRKFAPAAAPAAARNGHAAPADWRAKLPAVGQPARMQALPGAGAGAGGGAGEVAALNTELDALEERIKKLEAKRKK